MPLIRRGPNDPAGVPPRGVDADSAIAALRTGATEERWAAARSLATVPGAASALGQALREEAGERVREAIFTSLARINSAESLEAVISCLHSDNANLRTGALDALRAMPGAIGARLASLLQDADADIRILACDLAREAPSAEVMRLLTAVLETDPAVNVCAAAVDVLAEIGVPDVLPSLARCAERFPDQPFLRFAVKVASDRIGTEARGLHG
jgi:HEAT repeat protein